MSFANPGELAHPGTLVASGTGSPPEVLLGRLLPLDDFRTLVGLGVVIWSPYLWRERETNLGTDVMRECPKGRSVQHSTLYPLRAH